MVGTRALLRLAEHTHRAEAKLVLVGDHRQLPEIEAGGAFRALATRLNPIILIENRRQRDPVERAALAELRDGEANKAVERLAAHGRIISAATAEQTRDRMVRDWHHARLRGENAIMLAIRRADVADLNQRARILLQRDGAIGNEELQAAGLGFAVGDEVIALRNDRRIGLLNGQRASIVDIDPDARTIDVEVGTACVHVPAAYLDAGYVDHAYAMTVHKAQGLTCDRSLLLGDEHLYREVGYTALTRGHLENRLYAVTVDDGAGASTTSTAAGIVEHALRRSQHQIAGLDLGVGTDPHAPDVGAEIDL
jgi:ATP-dependent exoDNAse (exonuclease V) alpha subunit